MVKGYWTMFSNINNYCTLNSPTYVPQEMTRSWLPCNIALPASPPLNPPFTHHIRWMHGLYAACFFIGCLYLVGMWFSETHRANIIETHVQRRLAHVLQYQYSTLKSPTFVPWETTVSCPRPPSPFAYHIR